VLGLVGYKWRGAYVATKFALEGLTDVLRLEMRDTPIKVILLEPGPIASRIRENAIPHFERWFTPETSARAAQYPDLTKRLYEGGEDKFQLPASAVTAKLRHALEHPKPKARYYITVPTYLAAIMRRVLPVWAQDALISRN
jgi:NAD(P)-dependent dehydrogenase (short-subunit alcohol dehydrogenase family)